MFVPVIEQTGKALTVCVNVSETLVLKFALPLYVAVIKRVPVANVEVVNVASPALSVGAPNVVPPSRKVTVPVGVPTPGTTALTVAVNVTGCPEQIGVTEEPSAVVVLALLTTCVKLVEVLVLKLPSPPYTALMMWLETDSDEIANVARPELSAPVPKVVAPSLNVTVPVGVTKPDTCVTAAVNVTDWPNTEGLTDELTVVVALPLLTVCVKSVDVLPVKFPSPLYVAATVWRPVLNPDTSNVPMPEALMATGAWATLSTLNVNVPVRVPAPGATTLTVPVNVTDWPNNEGLIDELTAVVVPARLTVCVRSEEALPLKLASPLYATLTVCVPTLNDEFVNAA